MKIIIIISALLLSASCYSKTRVIDTKETYFVAGIGLGYSLDRDAANSAIQFGFRTNDVYFSGNFAKRLTNNNLVPNLVGFSVGYNIGHIQPLVAYNYNFISSESSHRVRGTENEFNNKWVVGYGLSYYSKATPICLTSLIQNKEVIISVILYQSF